MKRYRARPESRAYVPGAVLEFDDAIGPIMASLHALDELPLDAAPADEPTTPPAPEGDQP